MAVLAFVLLFCLFILGVPYALYSDSQKLEQPVVVFKAPIWREAPAVLSLLVFLGAVLVLACVLATLPTGGWVARLGALTLALVGLGLGFVLIWRHISYWQHDRHATLTVYRQEQRAEYRNEGVFVGFALADVVQITHYGSDSGRAIYSYQVFLLRDGTELLLTCLMYSILGPQELMPAARHQKVRCHLCWLPGHELRLPKLF
jgi:hypothetical protein